jgi:ABC-2 type transport system permease protein
MLLPLMLINLIIREPNGWVATFLSLFPLTSPVTMIARLVSTSVPAWQLLLAVLLLVVSTYFVLRIVARLFRAQVLLSGQSFSLPRLWALLREAE